MITINKKSWHYRLYEWSHMPWNPITYRRKRYASKIQDRQYNLCDYMKRILFLLPFKLVVKNFIALFAIIGLAMPFLKSGLVGGLLIYGIIIAILATAIGWCYFEENGLYVVKSKFASSTYLFRQYYRSIKEKHCPRIQFKSPNDE
ncbi:MAG: hypothetical protein ACP5N7_06505 [Candidatus Pacearchaeota archaeon]